MSQVIATLAIQTPNVPELTITAEAGIVTINGTKFLPHEANKLGDALHRAAWAAFELANEARRKAA